ncbi:hypothetical protein MLD38_015301 [Melastoma candidum]|uniref:Uncharacterized protein n=1 Tax=Melastoma candidum TaxID=119954 RepID=A0ACB9RF00_9MYRT|nr:hypothetical protein MLD38_015301 [Melastoma candidum]
MDSRSQLECLKQCMHLIQNGASLCVFPEGTRSKDLKLGEFKDIVGTRTTFCLDTERTYSLRHPIHILTLLSNKDNGRTRKIRRYMEHTLGQTLCLMQKEKAGKRWD